MILPPCARRALLSSLLVLSAYSSACASEPVGLPAVVDKGEWTPLLQNVDADLRSRLRQQLFSRADWRRLIKAKKLAVGLVDLSNPMEPRFAEVNGDVEMYAASLPKIEDAAERLTVAYEPIWTIGTGRTATIKDIAAMHKAIRGLLDETYGEETSAEVRILYGGSVKPENAREILSTPEVGGALVGGASLSAESFLGIVVAASESEDA